MLVTCGRSKAVALEDADWKSASKDRWNAGPASISPLSGIWSRICEMQMVIVVPDVLAAHFALIPSNIPEPLSAVHTM